MEAKELADYKLSLPELELKYGTYLAILYDAQQFLEGQLPSSVRGRCLDLSLTLHQRFRNLHRGGVKYWLTTPTDTFRYFSWAEIDRRVGHTSLEGLQVVGANMLFDNALMPRDHAGPTPTSMRLTPVILASMATLWIGGYEKIPTPARPQRTVRSSRLRLSQTDFMVYAHTKPTIKGALTAKRTQLRWKTELEPKRIKK